MQIINNFPIIIKNIDFEENDRYILHILRRKKDHPEDSNNESDRLIKTYYIDSKEYLKNKLSDIMKLCQENEARAYFYVQPRDNFKCLMTLAQLSIEAVKKNDVAIKPDRLLRTAYCGMHESRKKQWIIDLDNDNMHGTTVEDVEKIISNLLKECRKSGQYYIVPTKNGNHIVTSPFNLQKALKELPYMYEGVKNNEVGWLKKDSMTLAYYDFKNWKLKL